MLNYVYPIPCSRSFYHMEVTRLRTTADNSRLLLAVVQDWKNKPLYHLIPPAFSPLAANGPQGDTRQGLRGLFVS